MRGSSASTRSSKRSSHSNERASPCEGEHASATHAIRSPWGHARAAMRWLLAMATTKWCIDHAGAHVSKARRSGMSPGSRGAKQIADPLPGPLPRERERFARPSRKEGARDATHAIRSPWGHARAAMRWLLAIATTKWCTTTAALTSSKCAARACPRAHGAQSKSQTLSPALSQGRGSALPGPLPRERFTLSPALSQGRGSA
jgi:hypothetical protein